jgi:DNA-directed RNA polymerase subunit K/omega
MSKQSVDKSKADLPVEALMLECTKDRYKVAYAALRWAKEIKKKENLADAIPLLVPRAMREILTGKMSIKEIEKLPILAQVPVAPPVPAAPTITLNPAAIEPSGKDE